MHLTLSADVLEKFDAKQSYEDVNDIIEFHNIKKYFDNRMTLTTWDANATLTYSEKVRQFPSIIGKYIKALSEKDIKALLKTIDKRYLDDFWEIVENYDAFQKLSPGGFAEILVEYSFQMKYILRHPKIVKLFKMEIKSQLINTPVYAELLVGNYLEAHDERWHKLYFQDCLDAKDKETIIIQYINSEEPNLNYLALLSKSQDSVDLPLSDAVILAAQKRYNVEINKHFENGGGFNCNVRVTFQGNQAEPTIEKTEGMSISASYSSQWIMENLDYPTLLNNFIYLFDYVDRMFRSQFVHNERHLGALEQHLGVKGKKDYFTGVGFKQLGTLNTLQIMAYDKELERQNVDLLNIFKWFFETYLLREFGVNNFVFNVPSEGTTYLEKCKLVTSEIDSILKQFQLYVQYGKIDHELLQISSKHLLVKDIPSLIKDKYLYPKGESFQKATFSLFSDQNLLSYVERVEKHYESFYDLIRNEKIKPEDYTFQRTDLEALMKLGYIDLDVVGNLIVSSNKVILLKDLWDNGVSCPSYLSVFTSAIANMVAGDDAYYGSTLFSEPEQDYLNYILNRSEFSNGLDLRNKYSHGTQPSANDEEAHRQNYYMFLKIITLIIIKINEEFCLQDSLDG